MDKLFKAIGGFFKKIWEWIRQTAWVQPLLIVGIIFGLIFSINPIISAIQSAVNASNDGEFYYNHRVEYRELFSDLTTSEWGTDAGNDYYPYGTKLNKTSGDSLVIFIDGSNTLEDAVASFYSSHSDINLYVVDFSTTENQYSKWNSTDSKYESDSAANYKYHLLGTLSDKYNDKDSEKPWRTTYNDAFKAKYGYSVLYSGFNKDNTDNLYETSADRSSAASDLYLPCAVKFHNDEIVDMRLASSSSWTSYNTTDDSNKTNIDILADLWTGVSID